MAARADAVYEGVLQCQAFMQRLSKEYQRHVLESHGNHIPLELRNAACYLFAAPLLSPDVDWTTLLHEFLVSDALAALSLWVKRQIRCFTWPSDGQLRRQYDALIGAWRARVSDNADKFCNEAGPKWAEFWQSAHADAAFCPAGTEAAFLLFNFSGMWGTSENEAESVASLLKFYGRTKTLSFDRIVEKTQLRYAELDGNPACDSLIIRIWARFFGESLSFRFETKKPRARKRRFSLAAGSKTLHSVIVKSSKPRNAGKGTQERWRKTKRPCAVGSVCSEKPQGGNSEALKPQSWLSMHESSGASPSLLFAASWHWAIARKSSCPRQKAAKHCRLTIKL